jgi:hypothetical protein
MLYLGISLYTVLHFYHTILKSTLLGGKRMTDKQNHEPDFFTEFMFGKRPSQDNQADSTLEPDSEHEQTKQSKVQQPNPQADQLANIMSLIESLSPYLVKLAPLANKVTNYFSQDNKDNTDKKKNDD